MLGGGLNPGSRTSCAHSGPHWPGLLLFIIVGSGGWGRAVCLLPGVGEAKVPQSLAKSWDFLVLLPCYSLNVALRAGSGMGGGV